jgi:molybdopterin-guanine dinucleotide biosynthesis protein A
MSNRHTIWLSLNEKIQASSSGYLRSVMLINGGAAVAVLGFVSTLDDDPPRQAAFLAGIAAALLRFAQGVLYAVLAMGAAYFTEYAVAATFFSRKSRKAFFLWVKRAVHLVAIYLALASAAYFYFGSKEMYGTILHMSVVAQDE